MNITTTDHAKAMVRNDPTVCPNFERLTIACLRSLDRCNRRAEHNDTIQDIRLQRQARALGFRLLELATRHQTHFPTTKCTWEG